MQTKRCPEKLCKGSGKSSKMENDPPSWQVSSTRAPFLEALCVVLPTLQASCRNLEAEIYFEDWKCTSTDGLSVAAAPTLAALAGSCRTAHGIVQSTLDQKKRNFLVGRCSGAKVGRPIALFMCSALQRDSYADGLAWLSKHILVV